MLQKLGGHTSLALGTVRHFRKGRSPQLILIELNIFPTEYVLIHSVKFHTETASHATTPSSARVNNLDPSEQELGRNGRGYKDGKEITTAGAFQGRKHQGQDLTSGLSVLSSCVPCAGPDLSTSLV